MLKARLRAEEMRRDRFRREIDAILLAQKGGSSSRLARWLSRATLQRRREDLHAVNQGIQKLSARIAELEKSHPGVEDASRPRAGDADEPPPS